MILTVFQETVCTRRPCASAWIPAVLVLWVFAGLSACAVSNPRGPEEGLRSRALLMAEERRGQADREALAQLVQDPSSIVRARAARALGRIRTAWCVLPLGVALGDSASEVRAEAAFGLGQVTGAEDRGRATVALLTRAADEDARVRARVLQALGKLGNPDVVPVLMRGLEDRDARVRQHAALALNAQQLAAARAGSPWTEPQRLQLHAGLAAAWQRERGQEGAWRYVYTLANLRRAASASELDGVLEPGSTEESRIFALRGLAELVRDGDGDAELDAEMQDGLRRRLLWLLKDPSPRIRIEAALALGDPSRSGRNTAERGTAAPFADAGVLEALAVCLQDDNPQVARVAALGLGHFPAHEAQARQALQTVETSRGTAVQSGAILGLARLLGGYYASTLAWHAKADEIHRVLAAAEGLRFVATREAVPILQAIAARPEASAKIAALTALEHHREDRKTIDIALGALSDQELAVREAAVQALAAIGDATCIPALQTVLAGSAGEDGIELRQGVLTAISRIAPDEDATRQLLRTSLEDPNYAVRRVAYRLLSELAGDEAGTEPEWPESLRALPLPDGREYAQYLASRPRLEMQTSQGIVRFELWPDVAPVHVWNLLALCERGGYDGRLWHRVVPNFVVQGGDSTGTGSGSRSSFGFRLRDELGPKPFETGVLGMPRSSEPDTGGEQIFVTLVPTPHLDGRYTAFGRVTQGMDVLFRLSVFDRIDAVRVTR